MSRWTARTAAVGVVLGLGLTVLPAHATDDAERRGGCNGPSSWRLKAKLDDGRIEVEGRVYANRRGQYWKWSILHDGDVSFRGHATTRGSSKYFEVERTMVDISGYDDVGWKARNPRTGERCRGHVTI